MNLENTLLCERSQSQRTTHDVTPLYAVSRTGRSTLAENRLPGVGEKGWGLPVLAGGDRIFWGEAMTCSKIDCRSNYITP